LRWKISQINNGILEGLNSVLRASKRKARGYKAKHFMMMAYLLTGKLNFVLPTHFEHSQKEPFISYLSHDLYINELIKNLKKTLNYKIVIYTVFMIGSKKHLKI
jgi:hypothetical protein